MSSPRCPLVRGQRGRLPVSFDTRLGTDGSRPTASAPTLTGVSSHEPLFPDQPRTDKLPIYAHESHYGFLQRVKDPVFERVRSVLNEWFERFAEAQEVAAVKDLRNRLRGKGKGQFSPAFWELYLHELFARLGFDAQVHPASGRGTKPDFLLTGNGTRFYLEAVAPIPHYSRADSEPPRSATVIEYVNAADRPQFWLRLRYLIPGRNLPRKREVVEKVEAWLDTIDWDQCWTGDMASSVHTETELRVGDGWQIGLTAVPIKRSGSTDPRRPSIGAYQAHAAYTDGLGRVVLPTLQEKSTRYGKLDAPLLIAIWVLDTMAFPETAPLALFDGWIEFDEGSQRTGWELREDRVGLWTPGAKTRRRSAGVVAANVFDFGSYPALPDHGPGTGRTLGRRNDCRLSCPFRLRPSLRTNGRCQYPCVRLACGAVRAA